MQLQDRNEFRQLLRLGLGRAILYARSNDVRPFRDLILDACLYCHSLDPQCEGTQSDFAFELISALPDRHFYVDEIIRSLPDCGDDWDAVHRFYIALNLALDGDGHAREAMYASFNPGPQFGESIGAVFVALDGLTGFLFAAGKIGAALTSGQVETVDGWLWSRAEEASGDEAISDALLEAGTLDSNVEAFRLASLEQASIESHGTNTRVVIKALTWEQLQPRLLDCWPYQLTVWGREASQEDVERAARGLVEATSERAQMLCLKIFSARPYPLDPARLLDLAFSASETVAVAAVDALSQITHPFVREAAFRLVANCLEGRQYAIAMLSQNLQPGDHDVVLSWFEREDDRYVRHRFQIDLRKFWERHPEPAGEIQMLSSVYERGPCSLCRKFVIARLIELNALSLEMREECAFDACAEVRSLVGAG